MEYIIYSRITNDPVEIVSLHPTEAKLQMAATPQGVLVMIKGDLSNPEEFGDPSRLYGHYDNQPVYLDLIEKVHPQA